MSESMEKSRQATSGWRRTSLTAISALFAFVLARFTIRRRAALPVRTPPSVSDGDAFDSHVRLRMPVTMVSAPPDFTARVLSRIAQMPAPAPLAPAPTRVSWLRSLRVLTSVVTLALLLMLATGVLVTLVNPTLAMTILDALISGALGLMAFGRALGHLLGRASATPWMIPAVMGGLLGFLLLFWTQLVRQFGRDPQEA